MNMNADSPPPCRREPPFDPDKRSLAAEKLSLAAVGSQSALGDGPDHDSPTLLEAQPAQEPSKIFDKPCSSSHAHLVGPRQHIFDALCDGPSLTREDALALLTIRGAPLATAAHRGVRSAA